MSKRQPFTPGPWSIEDPMGRMGVLSIVARGERPVYEWRHVAQLSIEPEDADDIPAHEAKGNARVIASAPDLLAAAQLLEAAEKAHLSCPECEGEEIPELCPTCFPLYDDARIKRRLAIAKATGAP